MAGIFQDKKTGWPVIQFVAADGKRPCIRLGRVGKRQAERIRLNIEDLVASVKGDRAPDDETTRWVAGLVGKLRQRLVKLGLAEPAESRPCPTLGEWLSAYIASRSDVKANTKFLYRQTENDLLERFDAGMPLAEVSAGHAEEFRLFLHGRGLADATIRRRCGRSKQFFASAVRKRLISENPFAEIKCGSVGNRDRMRFVTHDEIDAVIAACPDVQWRLIFAFARYGGLRIPSEILLLTWEDIDWGSEAEDRKPRFVVHSPKTARQGKATRVVKLFDELVPLLLEAHAQAEPGEPHIITRYRSGAQNLGTQARRIIERAGLTPWPKVFVNLRSSRQTELTDELPMYVVCEWMGNSQAVAAKHYLRVNEDHFRRPIGNAGQIPGQKTGQKPLQPCPGETTDFTNANVGASSRHLERTGAHSKARPTPRLGLEPMNIMGENGGAANGGAANSGAVGGDSSDTGRDLQPIIDAWGDLPDDEKKAELIASRDRLEASAHKALAEVARLDAARANDDMI